MKKVTVLLLMTSLATGCVTTIQTHSDRDKLESGIRYYLPKTLLNLRVTYTVVDQTKYEFGVPKTPTRSVHIEKAVVLEPKVHADVRHPLVIDPSSSAEAAMLETKFGFRVGENGLLLGVDSAFHDHSGDFVQQLVGAAVSTAKLVAMAMAGPEDKLKARIKALAQEIAEVSAKKPDPKANPPEPPLDLGKRQANIAVMQKELTSLIEVQAALQNANRTDEKRTEAVQEYLLDPGSFTRGGTLNGLTEYRSNPLIPTNVFRNSEGNGYLSDAELPSVTVTIKLAEKDFERHMSNPLPQDSVDGVLYRAALPVETRIEVTDGASTRVAGSWSLMLPQFGRTGIAELRSKRAGDREIHATFNASGGLSEYRVDSGSSADSILKKIAASADVVQKAVGDIRYTIPTDAAKAGTARDEAIADSQTKSETLELRRETEALNARIANEKAKAELKKLQDAGSGSR